MNKSHVEVSFSWVLANMHWICKAFYGGAWFCCAEMCVSSECLYNKNIAHFEAVSDGVRWRSRLLTRPPQVKRKKHHVCWWCWWRYDAINIRTDILESSVLYEVDVSDPSEQGYLFANTIVLDTILSIFFHWKLFVSREQSSCRIRWL